MKTIVYHGPKMLALEEHAEPIAETGEVVVKVEAVGICGSELEGYLGHSSVRFPPLIMGHEFCGIIATMSEAHADFSVGDKIVVNPLIPCMQCNRCSRGQQNICLQRKLVGIHRPGAFAEYVTVPLNNLYKVPQDMNSALASLAEPLAVCIHGLKIGYKPMKDMLIIGAGPIGLLTLQVALHLGAGRVIVVDKQPARLQVATKLGAYAVTPEKLTETVNQLFDGEGVDTIVDCVGVEVTREQALQLINPGGTIVMVGLGHNQSKLSINHLVRQEIAMVGSYTYSEDDFKQALHLLMNNKINDDWIIERPLSEASESFEMLVSGKTDICKIILKP
jgi:2-desacetyl-2-hydroxyethyl bacteriochlorophyllide A dehydrogenase